MLNKFKRKFFDLNLIYKLGAFFLILLLFVTTLVYLYFPSRSKNQQISMIKKRIELASEITILFIQHSFLENNPELIKKAITPLKNNNEIEFYILADSVGNYYEYEKIDYTKKYIANIKSDTIYVSFDDKYIVKIKPIINNKNIVGYLGMGISLKQVNDYIFSLKRNIFVFVVLLLALGMYVIILYSNFILKPLFILQNSIQNISDGKYAEKIPFFYNDEIGKLTTNFNIMVENLELANKNLKLEFKRKELTEKELLLTQKHLSETIKKQKELSELKTRFAQLDKFKELLRKI
jgi:methyl-accepting chemotaxis protein